MKTHEIEIHGKTYTMRMTGTVGLVILAERILGATIEDDNKYHMMVLYYSCLKSCNEDAPDLMDFISSMTSRKLNAMSKWFWKEWKELDPPEVTEEKEQAGNP